MVLLLPTLLRLILIEICLLKLLNTIFIVYFYFLNWMFDFCWLCRAACRSQAINAGYILYKSKVGKAGYSNIIKRLCTLVCYARWHRNVKIWMWNIKTFLWCLYSDYRLLAVFDSINKTELLLGFLSTKILITLSFLSSLSGICKNQATNQLHNNRSKTGQCSDQKVFPRAICHMHKTPPPPQKKIIKILPEICVHNYCWIDIQEYLWK